MEDTKMTKEKMRIERDKKIYIDRATLFNGITLILNCFEGTEFEFKKNYSAKTRHLQHSGQWIGDSYITYKIVREDETVLEDTRYGYTMEDDGVKVGDKKINLDFVEVVNLLGQLCTKYPYLKGIIDKMRIAILLDGQIDEFDILNLARDYVIAGEGMADVTEYLASMQSHNAIKILSTLGRTIELKQKEREK
ncbi:MAG TPA: hypothetical protein DCY94_03085 [Firmicutes bacterium]|nr:hypothetical protein [Bacillota bacterium]